MIDSVTRTFSVLYLQLKELLMSVSHMFTTASITAVGVRVWEKRGALFWSECGRDFPAGYNWLSTTQSIG